jgi:hypothetical protein
MKKQNEIKYQAVAAYEGPYGAKGAGNPGETTEKTMRIFRKKLTIARKGRPLHLSLNPAIMAAVNRGR